MGCRKPTRLASWWLTLCLFAWTAVLAAACLPDTEPRSNGEMTAVVARVIDGDTFETESGERVRLIGVDTPESVKPGHPVEPYGKEASRFAQSLLTGQTVTLRFDVEPRDRYGRLLAYVYLPDGTFVNERLVREGYARVMTVPPNVAYADRFLAAEREARQQKRGLWGLDESASSQGSAAPDSTRLIKGNINSRGEKIYHVPGSKYYERTKAEVWFATVEEAEAAGFRPPR